MAKTILSLACPKCHFPARAEIEKFHKFIIYICPKCQSNVVFYDNKIDILSDHMINSLKKKKKLRMCGNALFPVSLTEEIPPIKDDPSKEGITKDKILDLKILLETEKDLGSLLSKI
jgi:NAD-dependent SIR2 family protein deacetylase